MIIEVIHVCAYVWMTRDKIVKGKYSAGFNSAVADNNRRIEEIQANSENCGPPARQQIWPWKKVKGQGHGMVPIERACHKDHACQISMLHL